jgi:hypothetical protein
MTPPGERPDRELPVGGSVLPPFEPEPTARQTVILDH